MGQNTQSKTLEQEKKNLQCLSVGSVWGKWMGGRWGKTIMLIFGCDSALSVEMLGYFTFLSVMKVKSLGNES